ncbi:DUF2867 domain-containing protein [Candidatus Protofrankia californiensis]|uniref:DUF2867 domain-containing protein n=1 Tax=Candidatus Protofrankia californiensis TaxID=1839754 RepID=UPI0010410E61|nr:DUF2867 domain-containing protein [Candidatus Protofrankia californiensis]
MRLPNTAHTSRPWRIHEVAFDFRLEDVWALPTPGGPDDFPRLLALIALGRVSQGSARTARILWSIRRKLGELLGWDDPDAGIGSRVSSLRGRLPADLREAPSGPDNDAPLFTSLYLLDDERAAEIANRIMRGVTYIDTVPFSSLYLLDDEWAAEIANWIMHCVIHIGWVPDGTGGHRGQMAILVKRNGLLGTTYMAAIKPFRHLIIYPAIMQQIGRDWRKPTHELVDDVKGARL